MLGSRWVKRVLCKWCGQEVSVPFGGGITGKMEEGLIVWEGSREIGEKSNRGYRVVSRYENGFGI